LAVSVGNSTEVVDAIISGSVELGFVEGPEEEMQDPRLAIELIARDDLVMVVSANHPWSRKEILSINDLAAGKWVLREDGSGTRATFVKALETLGVSRSDLNIAIELPSNETVLAAVTAGAGATILSARVCADATKAGTLKQLPIFLLPRAFFAVQHADHYRSRAVSALLEIIRPHAAV
jgi:DNA-binding transcriptional LysR family regulator